MFTRYDKFFVAGIMAAIQFANSAFGTDIGLDEASVAQIVTVATPLLVWLVPNRRF